MWLARREGVRAAQALAEAMQNRRVATAEVTDGLLIAGAGVLLFVPGLVTDLAGLLLLVPPVRALVRRRLVAAAERQSPGLRTARIRSEGPIVDGAVVVEPPYPSPDADRRVLGGEHVVIDGEVVDGDDRPRDTVPPGDRP